MRRGEIYYADLSPAIGTEINKRRPVLIVSNEANNRAANTVTVLPITNISRIYPFEIALSPKDSGLPRPSKAQAQQIRTISKERIRGDALGRLDAAIMSKAADAMRLHLDL
ncbi:MAG: type II toxin-antitoxin system PemK/MazF family toxin [Candidatus Binatus sp.]